MNSFSIGDAWSHAVAFLRENLQMLAVLIGGGVLLSVAVQFLATGQVDGFSQLNALRDAISSGDMSKLAEAQAASQAGFLGSLIGIVGSIAQSATQFAALRMGLARGEDQLGSALSYGIGASIIMMLFFILVGLGLVIAIALPIGLIFGVGAAAGGTAGGMGIIGGILALAFVGLILWLVARFSVFQPAMAARRSINPIEGMKESWRLTNGHALMILVYFLLLTIVAGVIVAVVGGVAGVVGGAFGAAGAVIFTALLIGIPMGVVSLAVSAGLYQSLTPDTRYDIFN